MGIFQRGKFLVDGNVPKGQIFGRWEFFKGVITGNFPRGQILLATSIFHDCVLFYAVTADVVKNLYWK